MLDHLGWDAAGDRPADPGPPDRRRVARRGERRLAPPLRPGRPAGRAGGTCPAAWRRPGAADLRRGDDDVDALAWTILGDDPAEIVAALDRGRDAGATPEELARAVAYAAALRITRFHTQNDHGDWDVVHHGFTAANAVHQLDPPRPHAGADPGHLPRAP